MPLKRLTFAFYYYYSVTFVYSGWPDEFINTGVSLPGCSTTVEPPEEMNGTVVVFNGSSWELLPNHRNSTVYVTDTQQPVVVDYLEEIKTGSTALAPATPYDKWNGSEWVTDAEAQYAAAIMQAENDRQRLLKHVDAIMLDWRTELMLGEISDANRAKLSASLVYKNEVKEVDVTIDTENVN
ncbi:tail fiber assembly protein [Citrobacter portucalensis]|nr:tail fiber assembly protein [Citrobacter freundii]